MSKPKFKVGDLVSIIGLGEAGLLKERDIEREMLAFTPREEERLQQDLIDERAMLRGGGGGVTDQLTILEEKAVVDETNQGEMLNVLNTIADELRIGRIEAQMFAQEEG